MKKKIYLLLATAMLLSTLAMSQKPAKPVKPVYGKAGIVKTIAELQAHNLTSAAIRKSSNTPSIKPYRSFYKKYNSLTRPDRPSRNVAALSQTSNTLHPSSQVPAGGTNSSGYTQQIWSDFLGIDFYENPIGWPPDPNGAVSNDQVIVCTNNGFKIVDKPDVTAAPFLTPKGYSKKTADGIFISLEDFFSAVLPDTSGISDPHIRYDRLSKRWFVVAIEVNPLQENNAIYLAVSNGTKITDTTSFTFYSFNSSLFPYDPSAPYAPFLDFPTLGVDNNAVVIGGNQFGFDSLTNVGYIVDKRALVKDGRLVVYPLELGVENFITGTVGGMYTPQGASNDDGTSKNSFFAGITYFQDALVVANIFFDHKNGLSSITETAIPVQPFTFPRDNSSPGSLTLLDLNDTRLLEATIHKNKITNESSLWTAHTVGVNRQGNIITGSDSDFVNKARSGARWYEINNLVKSPSLKQLGTVVDGDEPSGRRAQQYFDPSIAASGQGHAVLGGTTDAFNQYLNVFVAGRYNNDAPGYTHTPQKATNTTAIYAPYIDFGQHTFFYVNRWGDFSQTVVDPADDQTIWTFQEYADVDDSYGVRAVQVKAPAPATPLPLGTLSNKKDTTILVNGISVENSGFFDPGADKSGPGYKRLSVKSTGNVIVGQVTFISPTAISVKLNTKNQPDGQYYLSITNPDGQFVITQFTIDGHNPANTIAGNTGSDKLLSDAVVKKFIVSSSVYPNPADNEVKLQVNAAKDFTGRIILMNVNGSVVSNTTHNFSQGTSEASLSLTTVSKGTYVTAIYNQDNVLIAVHTIVKQ